MGDDNNIAVLCIEVPVGFKNNIIGFKDSPAFKVKRVSEVD